MILDLNKTMQLKIAAMILFWFGVVSQFLIIEVSVSEYLLYGKSKLLTPFGPNYYGWLNPFNFAYEGFVHLAHITAGYLLSKGSKKGVILGMVVSVFEIVPFLTPNFINGTLANQFSISYRILFGIVVLLIIFGRKELHILQSAGWRPWKNPLK
jgi:hypothetical protein